MGLGGGLQVYEFSVFLHNCLIIPQITLFCNPFIITPSPYYKHWSLHHPGFVFWEGHRNRIVLYATFETSFCHSAWLWGLSKLLNISVVYSFLLLSNAPLYGCPVLSYLFTHWTIFWLFLVLSSSELSCFYLHCVQVFVGMWVFNSPGKYLGIGLWIMW